MAGVTVEIHFDTTAAERRFLREYLASAWERFEASDHWETGWFWRYSQFSAYECGPDDGFVRLVFEGDPDAFVDAEAERWEAFDGLTSWSVDRYEEHGYDSLLDQQRDAKGAVGGEYDYRLKPLLSEFSLAYLQEFDEPLPAVGEPTDDDPHGYGAWAVFHSMMVQWGYDWYDETTAARKAMENRLKSLAAYRGADAAREEYERLRAEWEACGEELEEWLDEHPTGTKSEP